MGKVSSGIILALWSLFIGFERRDVRDNWLTTGKDVQKTLFLTLNSKRFRIVAATALFDGCACTTAANSMLQPLQVFELVVLALCGPLAWKHMFVNYNSEICIGVLFT